MDFGTSAVKLAQVERAGSRWRLSHARVIRRPTSETADQEGGSVLDWWSKVCHSQSPRAGFAGRRAACVLPSSRADLRSINVPEGTEAERRAMIGSELEALLGEGAGRRVFDFWETRPPGESSLERVNVISLPEDEAATVVTSLSRAGLRCRLLDGLPLALARAISMSDGDDPAIPVGVLDWGAAIATFSIVRNHRPVFTRQLRDCGFAAMPAAVSEALGLSRDDAEQLLTTHGLCDPTEREASLHDVQEVIADVTGTLLNEIVSQLQKTLAYPELHRSGLVPVKIWLLGGGATVRNVAAHLSSRIHLAVETWTLPCPESSGCAVGAPLAILGPAMALSALAFVR